MWKVQLYCAFGAFSLFPSLLLMHTHKTKPGPAQEGGRQGRRTRNHWHQHSVLHVYLGRLDHLNCPLECSPVWKWISLWHPVLASAGERLAAISPFNTTCVLNSKHTIDYQFAGTKPLEMLWIKRAKVELITYYYVTLFFCLATWTNILK